MVHPRLSWRALRLLGAPPGPSHWGDLFSQGVEVGVFVYEVGEGGDGDLGGR